MIDTNIEWAISVLHKNGYQLQTNIPDKIQDNPWAVVYRFNTNQGFVFLKQVPSRLALESSVINLLSDEFNAKVPLIIAETKHAFLMKDAGIQLHHYLKQNFNPDILIHTLLEYTMLQLAITDQTPKLFDLKVPDWRLKNLPRLYSEFINHESLLIEDGLSKDDVIKLRKLESKVSYLCDRLSQYKIKDTFGHADYHDKNILINPATKETTMIDLGEVVVTYPFFSIHNCLHRAKENFSLSDVQYHKIQMSVIKPWCEFESQKNIFEIFSIIEQFWSIHAVLGEYRLMTSVDEMDFQKLHRQGRFANKLRYWLNRNDDYTSS